ncbi:HAD family hydrolase [Paraburkholderia unamae]|uniref:Hydrolase of the HAD superfamily n=1 Tax=Paraburkholderia unamae TaxID=219649 RepID=A0ABX5KZL6_9BURK|nr:HAD family hydrolase [Paraburkholderia unamae]PVX97683.1 putative hydrolase of the HAD superfamily [Paraburkholderia unamae]
MTKPVVLCDADNTLWDTDSVFATAQRTLLDVLETRLDRLSDLSDRIEYVRRYDQALASRHHLHLRYPPVMLVIALAEGLTGRAPDEAATLVIAGHRSAHISLSEAQKLAADFLGLLSTLPELLPTVKDGLKLAREEGIPLYVVTEGRIDKQKQIITHHKLTHYIEAIFEITKTQSQFERLRQRFHPAQTVMVGDQPDRDIEPAKRAGCETVLVPSRFLPSWNRVGGAREASYKARDFGDAIRWVAQHVERGHDAP